MSKRIFPAIAVFICIALLASAAVADPAERDIARPGSTALTAGNEVTRARIIFDRSEYRPFGERRLYRHEKSRFMRRRHRTFVLFGRSRRGRHLDRRFIRQGRRSSRRYRNRGLYRHGKGSFMRRRHRTFAYYGYPGRGRYLSCYNEHCGYDCGHRFHYGRRR